MPAASSSVMNISETVTATATKNALSDVVAPLTLVCLTSTGEPIVARIGSRDVEVVGGEPREAGDLLERHALAARRAAGCAIAPSMIVCERRRPRMSIVPTSGSATSPPATITSM